MNRYKQEKCPTFAMTALSGTAVFVAGILGGAAAPGVSGLL